MYFENWYDESSSRGAPRLALHAMYARCTVLLATVNGYTHNLAAKRPREPGSD